VHTLELQGDTRAAAAAVAAAARELRAAGPLARTCVIFAGETTVLRRAAASAPCREAPWRGAGAHARGTGR